MSVLLNAGVLKEVDPGRSRKGRRKQRSETNQSHTPILYCGTFFRVASDRRKKAGRRSACRGWLFLSKGYKRPCRSAFQASR